jgi:Recombination endonuclease VII
VSNQLTQPTKKTCTKCGVEKPLGEFHAEKRASDGLRSDCKECENKRTSKYRSANPEKIRQKNQRYYAENADKVKDLSREWSTANRERKNEVRKKLRKSNPGSRRQEGVKHNLKYSYGLTIEQRDEILRRQGGGCAVCGIKLDGKTKNTTPHVDHCHNTGVVRGILCGKHNTAEGMLGSIENARKMVAYMEKNALFYSA